MFCKHVYTVPSAKPETVAAPIAIRTRHSPSAASVVVMAVGLIVVASAFVGFIYFRSGAETPFPTGGTTGVPSISMPVSTTGETPLPVTPVTVEPAAPPSAELVNVMEGTTSIGGRFYLVDFKNTGTAPIGQPAVIASGYDASGRRILEQPGYSRRGSIAAGETAVVLVLIAEPPAGLTRVDVAPRLETAGFVRRDVPVEVVESTERSSFGSMHEIVGTVRNPGDSRIEFVNVVAVGRDANGKPVSYADGFPTTHTLGPGASTGFTLSIGTFEISRPANWELLAFGQR